MTASYRNDGNVPLTSDFPDVAIFKEKVKQANVLHHTIEPLLKGADVLDMVSPGPQMGMLLKHAYEIQIEKSITDKEQLKEYVAKKYGKLS